MKKYVYYNKKIRCRVRPSKIFVNQIELQIQRKEWFFFWGNSLFFRVDLEECEFDSLDHPARRINPHIVSFVYGGHLEIWEKGTLNLKKRVQEFLKEYIFALKDQQLTMV